MTTKDRHFTDEVVKALDSQTIATDTDTVGDIIDLAGCESALFSVVQHEWTDGSYAITIEHGDAANLSDAAAVGATLTEAQTLDSADTDDTAVQLPYRGNKRYARIKITSTSTSTGCTFHGGVCVKGDKAEQNVL